MKIIDKTAQKVKYWKPGDVVRFGPRICMVTDATLKHNDKGVELVDLQDGAMICAEPTDIVEIINTATLVVGE